MLHLFSGDTVARKQEAPLLRFPRFSWKFVLTALALTLVTTFVAGVILVVANRFSSSAPEPIVVQTNPVVVPAPAVVDVPNPPMQGTAPKVKAPALTLTWVEIAHKVRNGEEVLALPIPWDTVTITGWGTADAKYIPDGVDPVVDFIRCGNYNLPPATSAEVYRPVSQVAAYLRAGNKVILYGYSDYYWVPGAGPGLTYWKAEELASKVEGQCP